MEMPLKKIEKAHPNKPLDFNIIVLSDLHLSEGWKEESHRFSSHEDFLFDQSFSRFLEYLEKISSKNQRKWCLIIAGDLIDFLQVTAKPSKREQEQLGFELSASEEQFGLGTEPSKTVWKLDQIVAGHEVFFGALGKFAASGNKVTIIKGNHDVEFHWLAVRERFVERIRTVFCKLFPGASVAKIKAIRKNIEFVPWFYYGPGLIYVEHGNQYEPFNSFENFLNPVLPDSPHDSQRRFIDLPLGSFFVRYFFNNIEAFTPFADNIKPPQKYIKQLLRKHSSKLLTVFKTFWAYRSLLFKTLRKTFQKRRFTRHNSVSTKKDKNQKIGWSNQSELSDEKIQKMKNLKAIPVMQDPSTYIKHLLPKPGRREKDFLRLKSKEIREILPDVKYVVFGHTHKADVYRIPGNRESWYFNVGTWTPIFSEEERQLREVVEFTFLQVKQKDQEIHTELLRWNDEVGEPEKVRLFEEPTI